MPAHLDLGPPYDSIELANTFLSMAWAQKKPIDPMKLLKLIYFAHGWFLALYEKPLINEDVQAWDYGPVVPRVYHKFKMYGSDPITDYVRDPQDDTVFIIYDSATREFLNKFWNVYGKLSAIQLSNLSHIENSPWDKTREKFPDMKYVGIPQKYIKDYFQNLAQRD